MTLLPVHVLLVLGPFLEGVYPVNSLATSKRQNTSGTPTHEKFLSPRPPHFDS